MKHTQNRQKNENFKIYETIRTDTGKITFLTLKSKQKIQNQICQANEMRKEKSNAGLGQSGHQVEAAKSRRGKQAQQDFLVHTADLLLDLLQQHLQLKLQFTSNFQVEDKKAWLDLFKTLEQLLPT